MSDPTTQELSKPLREDGAETILRSEEDPITGELMKLCLATARMRFMRSTDSTDAERESRLPVAPFDMEFFMSVLKDVFSRRDVLERVLGGESVASATGWDIG
jgi:hypothetical protein